MDLGDVPATVGYKHYRLIRVPDHLRKNMDIDFPHRYILRVAHRHHEGDVLKAVYQPGKIGHIL